MGTFGGSEDHTAIMNCRKGHLLVASFCPTQLERHVPVPPHLVFVVASSGVVAEKTAAARQAYNEAAAGASATASALGAANLGDALALRGDAPCREFLAGDLSMLRRFDQFAAESYSVVPGLADAVAAGDLITARNLAARSHALGEAALGNLVEETAWLPRRAAALLNNSNSSSSIWGLGRAGDSGALFGGSSAFGAGFGGSVWALVDVGAARVFEAAWQRDYRLAFPEHAETAAFFVMHPGPGACRL